MLLIYDCWQFLYSMFHHIFEVFPTIDFADDTIKKKKQKEKQTQTVDDTEF